MTRVTQDVPDARYVVQTCVPDDLTEDEIERCISIVKEGEAVDAESVESELPKATAIAVVRKGEEIVGVGVIKRVRHGYSAGVGSKAGYAFPHNTPELGHVARDRAHKGNKFAPRIVAALIEQCKGPLWATTDSPGMREALGESGFDRKGSNWKGNRGELSLWIKTK